MGDTLLVLDPPNERIALLDQAGRWLGTWPAQAMTGDAKAVRLFPTGERNVHVPYARPGVVGYVRLGPAGAADTVTTASHPVDDTFIVCRGVEVHLFARPFHPTPLSGPAPGGLTVSAWTGAFRFAFLTGEGATVRVVERERAPVPLDSAEWARVLEPFRAFRSQWVGPDCSPEPPEKPRFMPALSGLEFDGHGRLWVESHAADGVRLEAFTGDGRSLGRLAIPLPASDLPRAYGPDRIAVYVIEGLP